jgi:hypothetical protein
MGLEISVLVLGAAYVAMFHVLKIVEIMNGKRDLILNIHQDGERLTREQRSLLLWSDFFPLWLGVLFFLSIYSGVFFALPYVLAEKGVWVTPKECYACWALASFGMFALLVELIAAGTEFAKMWAFIGKLPKC